jgi:tetratricopeptide (TPR) repeat protein
LSQEISKKGKAAFEAGNFPQADSLFLEAQQSYEQSGDKLMAAEMKNNRCVALLQMDRAEEALEIVTNTDLLFEQAGDKNRQAIALSNQASALEALDRYPEAIEKYKQASDLLKELNEKEMRAYVLKSLAALQLKTGEQLQSLATMQAALESKKKLSLREKFLKRLLKVPFKMMH